MLWYFCRCFSLHDAVVLWFLFNDSENIMANGGTSDRFVWQNNLVSKAVFRRQQFCLHAVLIAS